MNEARQHATDYTSYADHAIAFNRTLLNIQERIAIRLPDGYQLMNPFATGQALAISTDFYRQFYTDNGVRRIILGINPGRHGAGLTGVPFTDSKQLSLLGIDPRGIRSFEPSAAFIYRVIAQFGGAAAFYRRFYINSPLPLGLSRTNSKGNTVNANYYDSDALQHATAPLIDYAMDAYRHMPIDTSVAYCLGQGKNYRFMERWNRQRQLFGTLIPLAHPRYVMQYRFKSMDEYITDYMGKLGGL